MGWCELIRFDSHNHRALFGEDQGRYVTGRGERDESAVEKRRWRVYWHWSVMAVNEIGRRTVAVSLADLRAAHEGFFPKLMGADAALA